MRASRGTSLVRSYGLDADLRFFSQRYLDGDEINANAVYFVPTTTLVDLKVGGQLDHFFWSAAVQNIFDRQYYDYGLDGSFPGFGRSSPSIRSPAAPTS